MNIEPTGAALGAFVTDIELTKMLDAEAARELRAAAVANKVVFLPGQDLSLDQLESVTEALGGRMETPFVKPLDGRPMVVRVLKEADAKVSFGEAWHTDLSYLPQPPAFTCLWSSDIPPKGGDTMWSNQAAAYQALDEETKAEIDGLFAFHCAGVPYGTGGYYSQVQDKLSMPILPSDDAFKEFRHPVVAKHPDTGEPVLFVNQTYTVRIDGYDKERSDRLLKRLFLHAVREEFRYRLQWRPHMLTIWDNRATQHFAINDYHGHRREMFRTSVKGAPLLAA